MLATMADPVKQKVDKHITGLAGEFFVAAEMLKRDLSVSITLGNAKSIDLFAFNPRTQRTFTVQVKALRSKNQFLIAPRQVRREHVYVFVILNKLGVPPVYFITPGEVLSDQASRFGKDFQHPTKPGIRPQDLEEFKDKWELFENPSAANKSLPAWALGIIGSGLG